jgi:sortase A
MTTFPLLQRAYSRLGNSILGAGVMLLACWLGSLTLAASYQSYENWRLRSADRGNLHMKKSESAQTQSVTVLRAGDLIGKIEIPKIGLSAIIREGTDAGTLLLAVGHLQGSALPGAAGNIVLSGHRDSFFRVLRTIQVGEQISITLPGRRYSYRVVSTTIVNPEDTYVLDPTPAPTLTLVTCYPFYFVGNAPHRFIVRAQQIQG